MRVAAFAPGGGQGGCPACSPRSSLVGANSFEQQLDTKYFLGNVVQHVHTKRRDVQVAGKRSARVPGTRATCLLLP